MGHMHAQKLFVSTLGVCAALTIAAPGQAREPVQISGTNHCKAVEQHAMSVAGDPDHVLVMVKATCDVSATGQSQMSQGGQAAVEEVDDLVKGTGPLHGYYMLTLKDGSTSFQTYAGKATTTMVDGKPRTAAVLTFEQVNGTGQMANAQFQGSAQGTLVSPTEFVSEFRGLLTEVEK